MADQTDPVAARTVEVPTPDGAMLLYEAAPGTGRNRRGVIVIQEAFGVNDHIEDVTRRFAAEGYLAVAPHLYHRTGGTTMPYDKFDEVIEHYGAMTDAGILEDVDAARAHLHEAGITDERTGIVGFCMGGRISFLVALRRRLSAAVTFYGGGIVTTRFEKMPALAPEVPGITTPWLGLFGDLDEGIPIADVERLRSLLAEDSTVDFEIVRYPDAAHGFHCDQRPAFHEASARDGWRRTLDWLDTYLA